ncbi:hypothetical protein CPB85DRAFT_1563711 [Mucidula mucida]|nr:hypothetical protein CPB85DRAFT_1563711 [Mucidula mucida]
MAGKRRRSPIRAAPKKRSKTTHRSAPTATKPFSRRKTMPNSFESTVRTINYLFDHADEMDGRESAFYEPLNETFGLFSRCVDNKGPDTITVAPQYSFRNELSEGVAGPSTRDDPVDTRARIAAEGGDVPYPQGIPEDQPHAVDDLPSLSNFTNNATDETLSALEQAQEAWRTPDCTLFRLHRELDAATGECVTTKVPFCIIESKPIEVDLDTDATQENRATWKIEETQEQMAEQLAAVFSEYTDAQVVPLIFVFVFASNYYRFYTVDHGAEELPVLRNGGMETQSLLNDDGTDFSDIFYQDWRNMMETIGVKVLNSYIK